MVFLFSPHWFAWLECLRGWFWGCLGFRVWSFRFRVGGLEDLGFRFYGACFLLSHPCRSSAMIHAFDSFQP